MGEEEAFIMQSDKLFWLDGTRVASWFVQYFGVSREQRAAAQRGEDDGDKWWHRRGGEQENKTLQEQDSGTTGRGRWRHHIPPTSHRNAWTVPGDLSRAMEAQGGHHRARAPGGI